MSIMASLIAQDIRDLALNMRPSMLVDLELEHQGV